MTAVPTTEAEGWAMLAAAWAETIDILRIAAAGARDEQRD